MAIDPMSGQEAPLAFRMLENMPGIAASVGFSSLRGANTMMYGGYKGSAEKYLTKTSGNFYGSKARRARMVAGDKTPFLRRAVQNNNPLNPRNIFRFTDNSVFAGAERNLYSPFAASGFLGKSSKVASAMGMSSEFAALGPDESLLGPGLLSQMSASTRVDRMERKLAKRKRFKGGLERKLGKVDKNISAMAKMNNAESLVRNIHPNIAATGNASGYSQFRVTKGNVVNYGGKTYKGGQFLPKAFDPAAYGAKSSLMVAQEAASAGKIGVRGNLMASNLAGIGTQKAAGFVRGAMGFANAGGFTSTYAKEGAEKAVSMFTEALGGRQRVASKALEKGVVKTIGVRGTAQALMTKQGAQVLGARALGLAIPGLQVVAAASFMYDVGKMAGQGVKSAINLGKDSAKSLQGSIYKPMFGMGYNDTEAAATSRSRGVMAIQNSRLNARSVLGSEAGMMAAHFG